MNYRIEKTFKSRRNRVQLIYDIDNQMTCVRKEFLEGNEHKTKEVQFLKILKQYHVAVPTLLYEGGKTIHMNYIGERTLLDYFIEIENSHECENKNNRILEILRQVFLWLDNYYKVTYEAMGEKYILNDIHFRNFLVSNDGAIYGIDFEDCMVGDKEVDGGKFCAFLLTYNPIFTVWKIMITKKLMDVLVNTFKYNREYLTREIECELRHINDRRWLGSKNNDIDEVMYWIKK